MADNGTNSSMVRRIVEPLIVAAVVGLLVMYGTVRIIQTQLEAVVATLNETRVMVKEDVRDMGEVKAWKASVETKIDYMQRQLDRLTGAKTSEKVFDNEAWEKRKR
jgi:hypothetical protein